jgi:malate dehydrogenase (oxaloacetate-decarboxylating)
VPLTEQRVAVFGAGSAGCGIASLIRAAMIDAGLSESEAAKRFFMVDRDGLLLEGMSGLAPFQLPFVQSNQAIAGWQLNHPDKIALLDVVRNARPTVLIGVSGQAGAFSEPIVRAMAECNARPVIFPLSNPTSREEATPVDIEAWTEGRALIGVGSPFPPIMRDGARFKVDQTNNSYIFPGVGLGTLAAGARRITDTMFMVAGKVVAELSPTVTDKDGQLLPPVTELRSVAIAVAKAVARQAQADGVADPCDAATLDARIAARVWEPVYRPYQKAG